MPNSNNSNRTKESRRKQNRRKARVNRDAEGSTIGIACFLTAAELRDIGIDLEQTDTIDYHVADGEIQLVLPNTEATNR